MKPETYTAAVPLELREAGERLEGVSPPGGPRGNLARRKCSRLARYCGAKPGFAIRTEHRGREIARASPSRHPHGVIRISAHATPEIRAAFASGRRFLLCRVSRARRTAHGRGASGKSPARISRRWP